MYDIGKKSKRRKDDMKKICDVCGKKAEGLGTCPTQFNEVILCSNCYESLAAFKNGRGAANKEVLEKKHQSAIAEMKQRNYPPRVIENVEQWFQEKAVSYEAKDVMNAADTFMMTTCPGFEGYRITAYHGVVSGESVLGTGFLSSWDASVSDMLGAESDSFTGKLQEARSYAKKRIVGNCVKTGGNALVGVDIEYTMFNSNMIGVIMNGTSVTIEKIEEKE